MTLPEVTRRLQVTGTAQRDAWRTRVLPPVEEVRPGLWSVPVPIPGNPLRYTLTYAFTADAGTVIVDPGWDSADGRRAFTAGLAAAGVTPSDVTGVIVTHVHPDHHGLSGWVREESGAWIAMHAAEAETLPARIMRERNPGSDPDWLRGHGVPEGDVPVLVLEPALMSRALAMPEPDRFVADGERLPIAGRDVRAIWTPGHTPGHLCLHDAAAGVLLTGDHLLPRITPNISVHGAPDTDPLSDYLASLARTGSFAAEEALPAHEYRFRGLDVRSAALIAHHRDRGAEILHVIDRLGQPTAWAIASQLTWSRGWAALQGMMRRMALAETVAHLHYLAVTREVRRGAGPAAALGAGQSLTGSDLRRAAPVCPGPAGHRGLSAALPAGSMVRSGEPGNLAGATSAALGARAMGLRWPSAVPTLAGAFLNLGRAGQVTGRTGWLEASAAPTWSANAMARSRCSRLGSAPGAGVIRNRPWRMPPLCHQQLRIAGHGRPAGSASRPWRAALTVPSCCSRAGSPIPATPYWKRHDCSDSNPVSCLLPGRSGPTGSRRPPPPARRR